MSSINFKIKSERLEAEVSSKANEWLNKILTFLGDDIKYLDNNINSNLSEIGSKMASIMADRAKIFKGMGRAIEKAEADFELCIEQGNAEDSCYEIKANQFADIITNIDSLCGFID